MNVIETVLFLLGQKNELFKDYEEITHKIVVSDFEELEGLFEKRECIKEKIDDLSQQLTEAAIARPSVVDAINNRVNTSSLSEDDLKIFRASQKNFAIINRILKFQPIVDEKMKWEKERLEKELKTLKSNRKVNALLKNTINENYSGTLLNIKK